MYTAYRKIFLSTIKIEIAILEYLLFFSHINQKHERKTICQELYLEINFSNRAILYANQIFNEL